MRLGIAILLLSVFGADVHVSFAAESQPRDLAQASQPPAPQPTERSAPEDQAVSFEDRIARFVNEFYLSGEERSAEDYERLYATTVDYFDKGRWSRSRVIADKRAYFSRWTSRSYSLLRDTLKVQRQDGPDKIYDIAFEYTFAVGSRSRSSRGRGVALLTMDLSRDGGRITRERGQVLERW